MIVKGIIFDINGTLSDIRTDEWHDDVYRVTPSSSDFAIPDPAAVAAAVGTPPATEAAACIPPLTIDPITEVSNAAVASDATAQARKP